MPVEYDIPAGEAKLVAAADATRTFLRIENVSEGFVEVEILVGSSTVPLRQY